MKKFRSERIEIEIYRRIPHEKLKDIHKTSWGLLFPSIGEEPLPYAVVESMIAGSIPIAARVGGVPEIVGETYTERFLFRPGSVEEFVSRIEEVISMKREDVHDIGIKLREEALKRFSIDEVKKRLLSVFG